ncbi:MAG: ATP-binding cassette domain-containing protein [Fidelibacterota bacterium]
MSKIPLFQLKNISKTAGGKSILKHIDMEIAPGEFFSVVGPSGCGKTTLLRLLNGLESFDSGQIFYKGISIPQGDYQILRKEIGMVFQNPAILSETVRGNLLIRKEWDKLFSVSDAELLGILAQVELSKDLLEKDARSLSGGEKQRLALARTLLNKPEVLLLDEPTANLDPRLGNQILNIINHLRDQMNVTIIMVSHNIQQMIQYTSRAAFLINGMVIEKGTSQILTDPRTELARRFLGNPN